MCIRDSLWPVRLAAVADPGLSDPADPVLDLALDGLLQDHSVRARGMRADRRREPLADPDQDRAAARDPRADLGLHLLLHAVLERVHLRAHVPVLDAEQDGAGGDRERVRRRRHLPLGIADGRGARGLPAARDSLRLLRRALRFGDDRGRKGIGQGRRRPPKAKLGAPG